MDEKNQVAQVKPWANPTPAGLVALAVACFIFFAMLNGLVNPGAMPLLGCWLIGGFVIQFIVALLDLKSGNSAGGNTFLYFSAYFMLVSGIEMLIKYFAPVAFPGAAALDARIDGWAWAALAFVVILWTPAFYKSPAILFILVLVLDVAVPLIALSDLKVFSLEISKVLSSVAGWLLLVCGLLGIYLSAAMVVNTAFGREVLKNPKPLSDRPKK